MPLPSRLLYQGEPGKITPIISSISRQELIRLDLGMGPHEEIAEEMLSPLQSSPTVPAREPLGATASGAQDPSTASSDVAGPGLPGSAQDWRLRWHQAVARLV
jgi:hypothetical protein